MIIVLSLTLPTETVLANDNSDCPNGCVEGCDWCYCNGLVRAEETVCPNDDKDDFKQDR